MDSWAGCSRQCGSWLGRGWVVCMERVKRVHPQNVSAVFRKSSRDVQCMLEYLSGSHKSSGGVSA